LTERYELCDRTPRQLGQDAAKGEVAAGLLSVVDYFHLEKTFERLGHFGIAVRGQARSTLLFAMKPIRQLDGAIIAVTEDTSTTVCLLRLLLEQRYHVTPAGYERRLHTEKRQQNSTASVERRQSPEADALLLIGDEALRFKQTNTQYPFEVDLGQEWWLWQHLPFVYAVWAIRKDVGTQEKKQLEASLARALGTNLSGLAAIGQQYSTRLGMSAAEIETYLSSFVYRLGQSEEEGIKQFKALAHDHRLL